MQHRTPLMVLAMIGLSQVSYAASDDSAASARLEARAALEQNDSPDQNRSQRSSSKKVVKRVSSRGGNKITRSKGVRTGERSRMTANGLQVQQGRQRVQGVSAKHGAQRTSASRKQTQTRQTTIPNASKPPARERNTLAHTSRPPAREHNTVSHTSRPPARDKGTHHTSRPQSSSSRPHVVTTPPPRPHTTSTRVVRTSPNVRVVHRRPTTRIHHVRPYHGVLVYGPRTVHHTHYVHTTDSSPQPVQEAHLPKRSVDRDDSFAVGLRMGNFVSGYDQGGAYADLGYGLTARYRPEESVGLELSLQHFDQTFDSLSERAQTQLSGSVQMFAFPWKRVSPFASVGLSSMSRQLNDTMLDRGQEVTIARVDSVMGPHAGLGLELALGQSIALDFEARYTGYIGTDPLDDTLAGGFSTNAGLLFHF